jgi:hypothetical protein
MATRWLGLGQAVLRLAPNMVFPEFWELVGAKWAAAPKVTQHAMTGYRLAQAWPDS